MSITAFPLAHARSLAFLVLGLAALAPPARAVDASSYLMLPTVNAGEHEFDFRTGVGSAGHSTRTERDAGVGLGWGVNDRWFTELALQYRRAGQEGTVLDAVEWENVVPLAETNEWPVDVAIGTELELPNRWAEGPSLRVGPLLQKEWGLWQANANFFFGHHVHGDELRSWRLSYQAQVKYRYSQPLEFGVQAFGGLSSRTVAWAPGDQQVHRIGPVLLGKRPLAHERSLSYNAAFLLGTTGHSPDRTFRVQVEYEF